MKYAYTILYVNDVLKTVEFYEKCFGFKRKFITPEKDYGELVSGETTIAFASIILGESNLKRGFEKSSPSAKPFGIELIFTTENIEVDFKKAIDNGALVYENVQEKPWKQHIGYLKDNNGFFEW